MGKGRKEQRDTTGRGGLSGSDGGNGREEVSVRPCRVWFGQHRQRTDDRRGVRSDGEDRGGQTG